MSRDVTFSVSVKDVPDHLDAVVSAYIALHLDVITSEIVSGLEDLEESLTITESGTPLPPLTDEDYDAIARLATDVTEL